MCSRNLSTSPHRHLLHPSTISATTSPTFSASDLISVGDFDVWSLSSTSRSITPIPDYGFSDNDLIILQVSGFLFQWISLVLMNALRSGVSSTGRRTKSCDSAQLLATDLIGMMGDTVAGAHRTSFL